MHRCVYAIAHPHRSIAMGVIERKRKTPWNHGKSVLYTPVVVVGGFAPPFQGCSSTPLVSSLLWRQQWTLLQFCERPHNWTLLSCAMCIFIYLSRIERKRIWILFISPVARFYTMSTSISIIASDFRPDCTPDVRWQRRQCIGLMNAVFISIKIVFNQTIFSWCVLQVMMLGCETKHWMLLV